ncbi:MAG: Ldh family oxidoreductase [Candidatus Aenigmarchaeota archaeon]|nr:Ldh family oxidoreductase [Candidatus Aenigmarchaeota archaeon]
MKIKISELKEVTQKAILHYGYSKEEASIIQDVLLYAQLRGNNQGVVKLIGKGLPKNPNETEIKIEKETKLSAKLDGGQHMGMIVMKKALEIALAKAKEHGFGIVGTHNTKTSTGAIGYYANEIAKQGYIGFVFAGSPETVAPHGSYQPIFGTNPLAIGIPSDTEPIVLDMATAAMAYYGLIEAKIAGRKIPSGIAYDKEGNLTDDPNKAMEGALRPFDKSHKSSGLSFMIQILCGPLVGAAFSGFGDTGNNWGNLIMVFDPELLADKNEFKKGVGLFSQKVKETKKLPGVKEIYFPGERGTKLTKENLKGGYIEIEDNLWNSLLEVSRKK